MNLYLDNSALIKLYVRETGSDQVIELLGRHPGLQAALTQSEMASAMAKAGRLGWVEETALAQPGRIFCRIGRRLSACRFLPRSWSGRLRSAGGMACAPMTRFTWPAPWPGRGRDEVVFACFDQALTKAARREGLQAWPE